MPQYREHHRGRAAKIARPSAALQASKNFAEGDPREPPPCLLKEVVPATVLVFERRDRGSLHTTLRPKRQGHEVARSWAPASRLLRPCSGLERSDFVQWPAGEVKARVCCHVS